MADPPPPYWRHPGERPAEYDVFLSYASEDRRWCERLAEGLEQSRRMVALFSSSYFRHDKCRAVQRATARMTWSLRDIATSGLGSRPGCRPEQSIQLREQLLTSMIPALRDQLEQGSSTLQIRRGSHGEKRPEVDEILWPALVVSRQDLECDEISPLRNGDDQAGKVFELFGARRDLGFDSGGREEKVDDDGLSVVARRSQSHRRQAAGVVLEHRDGVIAGSLKASRNSLGLTVVRDVNHQIDISGEPGFGARADREAAHERPSVNPRAREIRRQPTQRFPCPVQIDGRLRGLPTPSPSSAPGRVSNH